MTRIASSPADMRYHAQGLRRCAVLRAGAGYVAAKGLAQEAALNEGLIAISMANVIRKTCPSISARMLKAWLISQIPRGRGPIARLFGPRGVRLC